MSSRLAHDDVMIVVGALRPVSIRPSLRAAIRLEARYGWPGLATAIAEGNLTIMADMVREGASGDCSDLLDAIAFEPLGVTLKALQAPLITFLHGLIGLDLDEDEAPATPSPSAKPFDWQAHHERLFEIGTGWLGWSPEVTWSATPAEISSAFKGRNDLFKTLLGAVFGTAEEEQPEPQPYVEPVLTAEGLDPEFDRAGLLALRAKMEV